jgi:hypothetical protein
MSEQVPEEEEREEPARRRLMSALVIDHTPLAASRDYRLLFIGQFVSGFGSAIGLCRAAMADVSIDPVDVCGRHAGSCGIRADAGDCSYRRGTGRLHRPATAGLVGGTRNDDHLNHSCFEFDAGDSADLGIVPGSGFDSGLNAIHRPSLEALTPRLVDPEHIPAVSALSSVRYNFNFIVGPSIAGVIAASWGAAPAFAINALAFIASIIALVMIRSVPVSGNADQPGLRSIAEGLRYARSRQELLGTYLIDLNAMFFGMPMALFPAIAESFGNASVGLFYSAPSVGSLLVTLTSGWARRINRHGLAVTLAATAWGAAIIGFGLVSSLWTALIFLAIAGEPI